jgi:hypothetical protein
MPTCKLRPPNGRHSSKETVHVDVHYHTLLRGSACTLAAPAAAAVAAGPCAEHEGVLAATRCCCCCCCWVPGSLLLLLLLGVFRHEGFHARLPAADEVKTRRPAPTTQHAAFFGLRVAGFNLIVCLPQHVELGWQH